MARPRTDLVGQRFGRFVVTEPFYFANGMRYSGRWCVICDCGNIEDRSGHQLMSGKSKQCLPCQHAASTERAAKNAKKQAPFMKVREEMFCLLDQLRDGKIEPKEALRRAKEANRILRGRRKP